MAASTASHPGDFAPTSRALKEPIWAADLILIARALGIDALVAARPPV